MVQQSVYNPYYYASRDQVYYTTINTGDQWYGSFQQGINANEFPYDQQGYEQEVRPYVVETPNPFFSSNKYDSINITANTSFPGDNKPDWIRFCNDFYPLQPATYLKEGSYDYWQFYKESFPLNYQSNYREGRTDYWMQVVNEFPGFYEKNYRDKETDYWYYYR